MGLAYSKLFVSVSYGFVVFVTIWGKIEEEYMLVVLSLDACKK